MRASMTRTSVRARRRRTRQGGAVESVPVCAAHQDRPPRAQAADLHQPTTMVIAYWDERRAGLDLLNLSRCLSTHRS